LNRRRRLHTADRQIGRQFGRFDAEDAAALAEDHLAELLGFAFAGKGASKAEHRGIPGLLWIEQGSAQAVRDAVGHAAGHLQRALNGSAPAALVPAEFDLRCAPHQHRRQSAACGTRSL
jgi:hypothetical protein